MRYFIHITFLLVGFFLGVGSTYTATSMVINLQAKKVAALSDAYYMAQAECRQKLEYKERKRK